MRDITNIEENTNITKTKICKYNATAPRSILLRCNARTQDPKNRKSRLYLEPTQTLVFQSNVSSALLTAFLIPFIYSLLGNVPKAFISASSP